MTQNATGSKAVISEMLQQFRSMSGGEIAAIRAEFVEYGLETSKALENFQECIYVLVEEDCRISGEYGQKLVVSPLPALRIESLRPLLELGDINVMKQALTLLSDPDEEVRIEAPDLIDTWFAEDDADLSNVIELARQRKLLLQGNDGAS